MDKRTTGIIATIATALICGCCALLACVWGILIATETPFDTTVDGVDSVQTFPPTVGYVLLCLSVIFIAIPVVVGVLTLRKKPEEDGGEAPPAPAAEPATPAPAEPSQPAEPKEDEPLPPAS